MVAGRVVRFDSARGYGFIAPAHGGEDVFLHVNDLLIPEEQVRSGLRVEFEIEQGDKGLKASSVRLAPAASPRTAGAGLGEDGEPLCDVLSEEEFTADVTELLLSSVPSLTGSQILQIRQELLGLARGHGWLEG